MLRKINNFRLLMNYLRDPDNSTFKKIIFFLPLLYFLSPVDLLPDVLFPFGYIEDIGFLIFGWQAIKQELDKYSRGKSTRNNKEQRGKRDKDNVIPLHKDDYDVD